MQTYEDLGLDVDGVLCNFAQGIIDKAKDMGLAEFFPCCWRHVKTWMFSDSYGTVWSEVKNDEEFWLNLKPLPGARETLLCTPRAYVTSRPVPNYVTEAWLYRNRFPAAEVVTVGSPEHKFAELKRRGIRIFADDLVSTVTGLREEGIDAVLFAAPYQCEVEEVASKLPTIHSLAELGPFRDSSFRRRVFDIPKITRAALGSAALTSEGTHKFHHSRTTAQFAEIEREEDAL